MKGVVVCRHCVSVCQKGSALSAYNRNFNMLLITLTGTPLIFGMVGAFLTNNTGYGILGVGGAFVGIQAVELVGGYANLKDKKRNLDCVKNKV